MHMYRHMTPANTLSSAHILIIGVGALGSETARRIVESGVKRITLCDYDIVEESNLARQPLYAKADIGRKKVDAAKDRLIAIAPDCRVTTIDEPFSSTTSLDGIDIIIEGTDSLDARHLINDTAKRAKIPLVIGMASKNIGFAIGVGTGACFDCIFGGKQSDGGCESDITLSTVNAIACLQVEIAAKMLSGDRTSTAYRIENKNVMEIIVKRNISCRTCRGEYEHLQAAPFTLRYCQTRDRIVATPSVPRIIDLERLRHMTAVLQDYGTALRIAVGSGSVLVHRHGTLEFSNVDDRTARAFVKNTAQEE